MPLVSSQYFPKGLFKNGHFSTIYSAKLRTAPKLVQQRERLQLEDGDFMDLDFAFSESLQIKLPSFFTAWRGTLNAHTCGVKQTYCVKTDGTPAP